MKAVSEVKLYLSSQVRSLTKPSVNRIVGQYNSASIISLFYLSFVSIVALEIKSISSPARDLFLTPSLAALSSLFSFQSLSNLLPSCY
uniref:Uncharacterized protein n=1 Tax=Utricularia reniformis TaxID=192314 RepID=A0A1Y0B171_9LAMI|nr:hypothetical protein AEK19_MT0882 [Utricularia reniformis]ART31113.1 hypothetical protein AEK19_MT0882 [Utricularia reniformis]